MSNVQEAVIRTLGLFAGTYLAMRWSIESNIVNDDMYMLVAMVCGIVLAYLGPNFFRL
jgi:uncharacterized YccA/Bax inhibitor family protein